MSEREEERIKIYWEREGEEGGEEEGEGENEYQKGYSRVTSKLTGLAFCILFNVLTAHTCAPSPYIIVSGENKKEGEMEGKGRDKGRGEETQGGRERERKRRSYVLCLGLSSDFQQFGHHQLDCLLFEHSLDQVLHIVECRYIEDVV